MTVRQAPLALKYTHPWSNRLQQVIIWLFHLLMFVTPFLFTFVNDELFEFNKMLFVYLVTALIVAFWGAQSLLERKILFKATPLDWAIFTFFGSQLLSTAFSMHLHTSIFGYYSRFHGGLLSTLCYVLLFYAFVNTFAKKNIRAFLITLLLSASLASLYAVPEHFQISPSCWILNQELTTNCWSENTNPKYRIFGTFGQPNWLAAYAVIILPLGVTICINRKETRLMRWLSAISSVLLFLTLLFTKSRSGFLGLSLAGIVLFGGFSWMWWSQWKEKTEPVLKQLSLSSFVTLGAILFFLAVVFGTPYSPSAHEFLTKTQENASDQLEQTQVPQPVNRLEVGGTDSGEIRRIVWQGAWDVWQRYPLLGSGVETFAYSYYLDRPPEHNLVSEWDFLYNKAHNEFLNFLATTGIFGFGTYVFMLGSFGFFGVRYVREEARSQSERALIIGLLAGVAALTVTNFFGFSTVMVSVLLFLFFAVLTTIGETAGEVIFQEKKPGLKRAATYPPLSWWQIGGLAATAFTTLFFLNKIINYWQADYFFAEGKKFSSAGYHSHALELLTNAAKRSPTEAVFYNELGQVYAQVALSEIQTGSATSGAQLAEAAIINSTAALKLNPHQLNFYKTYAQVLIRLSPLEQQLLEEAQYILENARKLAPTDPRLTYNLSLVEDALGNQEQALEYLKKTIALKPNYGSARLKLGQKFTEEKNYEAAAEEYLYILAHITPNDPTTLELLAKVQASASAQLAE